MHQGYHGVGMAGVICTKTSPVPGRLECHAPQGGLGVVGDGREELVGGQRWRRPDSVLRGLLVGSVVTLESCPQVCRVCVCVHMCVCVHVCACVCVHVHAYE